MTITPKQEIFVNQKKVTEAGLEAALREVLGASADKVVILRGDREVLLGQAVKVLSIIKKAGALEIAIAAEAERKSAEASK